MKSSAPNHALQRTRFALRCRWPQALGCNTRFAMDANRQHEVQDPIVKKYSRLAEVYDTKWSFYIEATTRETTRRLSLRPTDRLLDVGCGTGALLHHFSTTHPVVQLFGVDPVPEMLAIARHRLSPSIELREGWVEHLPFAAETVRCCRFLQHVSLHSQAHRRVARDEAGLASRRSACHH